MQDCRCSKVSQYTIGIICALDKELLAVRCLLDAVHPPVDVVRHDTNCYTLGRIGRHCVIATCLPAGEYDTNSAASIASQMRVSFPAVEFCLLVGIAGGIPGKEDIRLGDVVVSLPVGVHSGVIQHDLGKAMPDDCFVTTGSLQRPPRLLLGAISNLRSTPGLTGNALQRYIDVIARLSPAYRYPGKEHDILFQPDCIHDASEATCDGHLHLQVPRVARESDDPYIHYDLVGSGNKVIKDATLRDRLGAKYNIVCLETVAAGILNVLPCLVIRGICDYCDSHNSKFWQEYAAAAAAAAAAYAKLLLSVIQPHHLIRYNHDPRATVNEPRMSPLVSDIRPAPVCSQNAPTGLRSAEDILRKAQTYAERRGLWKDIPPDATPFIRDFSWWPQTHGAVPRVEDFAYEAVSLLKSQGQPVIWTLYPEFSDPLTIDDVKHCLAQQVKQTPNCLTDSLEPTMNLDQFLASALENLGRFFLVLQVRDLSLATWLLRIVEPARRKPGGCVKYLVLRSSTRIHVLPPPPPPTRKRKRTEVSWHEMMRASI
ncbi:nucleoside phosphorylase domain-containing protein [Aspergillus lucknowensis]|uniref:Nucleoside phosphorylase domain-containing protein n=1 Tax=Aspergillus lucknowensis TaxID=176173 RepID=A0ABR4M041_9EURO